MTFGIINARMVDIYARNPDVVVIDLRSADEYAQGHVKNAVRMDMESFEREIKKYDVSATLLFYCDRGANSMIAARTANEMGYNAKSVIGGYQNYLLQKHEKA